MQTDLSSGALPAGLDYGSAPAGYTDEGASFQRGWFGKLVSGTASADYQDFMRSEMSANNQYLRDLALQNNANDFSHNEAALARDFNANEAQKQRDYEERLSNTAYQRAVEDMKIAGINPALVLPSQGGASTPQGSAASGSAASASSAHSSGSSYHHTVNDNSALIIGSILASVSKVAAGMIGGGKMGKIGFGD